MSKIIKYDNPDALDLLEKMIVFNPNKRITIEEALEHNYAKSIKDDGVEDPIYDGTLNLDFD